MSDTGSTPVRGSRVFRFPAGGARRVFLAAIDDSVRQARVHSVRRTVPRQSGAYQQAMPWDPPQTATLAETHALVQGRILAVVEEFPTLAEVLQALVEIIGPLREQEIPLEQALVVFTGAMEQLRPLVDRSVDDQTWSVRAGRLELLIGVPEQAVAATEGELRAEQFLAAVGWAQREARAAGRSLTVAEKVAEQVAHALLATGVRTPLPYQSWGTSGFRRHQTYMSVTDPGEGHLDGTVRDAANLDGVIVHIEHLERGNTQAKDDVEPYRIPYPHLVGRVRLALADDAPCSSYVGRPVFEGGVDAGMLKAVHTVAAACSDLFANGLAECKIAIEGMTALQAVRYMRQLDAAIRRDRFTQILSAAFNLNTPVVDDFGAVPVLVTERLALGRLAIRITAQARYAKVTWDGAGNSYPSGCVLGQLSRVQALTLVHEAHEQGLLTYFSAGFRFEHLTAAVFTGVDGVGIGGAQILRYLDPDTGHHGPFLPGNIARILAIRNEAEAEPQGRAAALLSRLDRMFYELSIDQYWNHRRRELFVALRDGDERTMARIVAHRSESMADGGPTLLGWVRRLTEAGADSLYAVLEPHWRQRLAALGRAAAIGDLDHLAESLYSLSVNMRQSYWTGAA